MTVEAQHWDTEFGQSRIQYKKFEWFQINTNDFEVYFHQGGKEYAEAAVEFLQNNYTDITNKIGYAPYTKPKIFIYNSIYTLQQSNIGIGGDVYTIGGKTNFMKMMVELPYPGQAHKFQEDLVYGISKTIILDMLFGGSIGQVIKSAVLLNLPDWFVEGAARYIAYRWDEEMDSFIQGYIEKIKIKKKLKVKENESGWVGQSIWNYIASTYGESNISNILNLTRIIRKEDKSISNTLGVDYKEFLNNWKQFYVQNNAAIEQNYSQPDAHNMVATKKWKELIKTSISINPLGNKLAYAKIKNGRYFIYVYDIKKNKETLVTSGGYKLNNQEFDKHLPLLDWKDAKTLGAIIFRRGRLYLETYNLQTGKKNSKILNRFRQIQSFSFNDDGRLIIISGDIDGKNDLFLTSMRRNTLKRITHDVFDDINPVFFPGTSAIVFSSNRINDSLKWTHHNINDVNSPLHLYLYDLDTSKNRVTRLTNTFGNDTKAIVKNRYFIYYLSDQKGITNLFRFNLLDTTYSQVTNFNKGIESIAIHFDPDAISFIMLDENKSEVFYNETIDLLQDNFTKPTPRQEINQLKKLYTKKKPNPSGFKIDIEKKEDSIFNPLEPDNFSFEDENSKPKNDAFPEGFNDTDNYIFSENKNEEYKPDSFFKNYNFLNRKTVTSGILKYTPKFSFRNVTTTFANDPLRGFGFVLNTEVIDVMENHRFIGGAFIVANFNQSNLFGEYHYLPLWADLHLKIKRDVYKASQSFEIDDDLNQQYFLDRIEVGVTVPITHTLKASLSPFYVRQSFNNLSINAILSGSSLLAQDYVNGFMGGEASIVFDNTVTYGFNIITGTRAKLKYSTYQPVTSTANTFSQIKFDFRHYQKIHREITLSSRLFYGKFWGVNPPQFVLGGVDNWLFNKKDSHKKNDPLALSQSQGNANILFTEFATNLRGFNYNTAFGSNTLLANVELRIPLFNYFIQGPITSNFFRNFQLIYFYDIGITWDGPPPFIKKNIYVKEPFEGTPFSAELTNFTNPWLQSHGMGVRMSLMGYFLKVDRAQTLINFKNQNVKWHISLGVDF